MARGGLLKMPDHALDGHSARGRRMGRAEGFFQAVGRHVENLVEIDGNPWAKCYRAERPKAKDEG